MSNVNYRFPRESRLLTPKNFSFVFEDAIPAPSPTITLLARYNTENTPRLGITVPKKKVRRACDRNQIKRLIRESFRLKKHTLPNVDIIVIIKHGVDKMTNDQITNQLDKLWKKMSKRCEAKTD